MTWWLIIVAAVLLGALALFGGAVEKAIKWFGGKWFNR